MVRGWSFIGCFALTIGSVACSGERAVRSNDDRGETGGNTTSGGATSGGGNGGTAAGSSSGGGNGGTAAGSSSGGGSGGSVAGASSGGSVGSDEPYGLYVHASTVSAMVNYTDVVASRRDLESGTEVSVVATIVDANGTEGHTAVFVGPNPAVGTFPCAGDAVYLTTRQVCCPAFYDSRNTPGGPDCSVTLTEVGSGLGTDIAGTFDGFTYDINGGRMRLQNGRFRARFEP